MATEYWDYDSTTSTGWTNYTTDCWSSCTSGTANYGAYSGWSDTSCTTSATVLYSYIPPRQILVEVPPHWNEEVVADFCSMINDSPHESNWRVSMVISGDVRITDPSIDVRDMASFILLLKRTCSPGFRSEVLPKFLELHSIDPPEGSEAEDGKPD